MNERRFKKRTLFLIAYLIFALLPIYWMVNMSFKTNEEILSSFTLWPETFTWANYRTIFTDASWYSGYINSLIYVGINTVISLTVALPAAYAFSRYRFLGDKHVFFWLLTNRMTPPAVFLLPFFPKDALCYVAGLTGVAWPVFILISFFGRLPGQVMSALVGADIITVPVWGWVLIALGAAGLLYLSFRYSERIGDWLMGKMGRK